MVAATVTLVGSFPVFGITAKLDKITVKAAPDTNVFGAFLPNFSMKLRI